MENKQASLVEALRLHREILRRETTFLRREVASQNLATNSSEPPPSKEEIKEVNSPYIVTSHEEPLDLLLREADQLRYRIQSLPSTLLMKSVSLEKKAKMLTLISQALLAISQHIMKSSASADATTGEEDGISSYHKHRAGWKSTWGCVTSLYGFFDDITTLSPMHFTRSTPGIVPHSATTWTALQIYSIKIIELNPNLDWPIYVCGVVAARDTMDRNRNILFYRSRANCQKLTQADPFLRLTGPSRAIVVEEDVTFEVELKIKYGAEFQHIAALSCNYRHCSKYDDTPEIGDGCCTVQVNLEHLGRAVQATIMGVQVIEGGWPFKDRARISCFLSSREHREVVLLDCHGGETPVGSDDYFCLSRSVVTMKLQEKLRVVIQGYSEPGCEAQEGYVDFLVNHCQTSEGECLVGNSKVKVDVAWSLLVTEKLDLAIEGYVLP